MTQHRLSTQPTPREDGEPIVITGIGMIASVGNDRESVWRAVREGKSGVRPVNGLLCIPDGMLIGAPVDVELERPGQLKQIPLAKIAAQEAMKDANVDLSQLDLTRFGCAISAHVGDSSYVTLSEGFADQMPDPSIPWWEQWLPDSTCVQVANHYGLCGPRMCHSVACASGLVDFLSAVRGVRDGMCDIALAGSADAFHPVIAAGFRQMKVLAHDEDPTRACRPFDANRKGFVMGEGAAMFVIERLSHATRRGARIYAEVTGGKMLAQAHHVTGLDAESEALAFLISNTLREARIRPDELRLINAHGTGTLQNDLVESRGIHRALGEAAKGVCVSANKSMLGHLVNAAGSVELALTVLALRDGFAPPTINLTEPDPECNLDCTPLVGRRHRHQNAMKLSVAFGGHLVAVTLRRWSDAATGFAYPAIPAA